MRLKDYLVGKRINLVSPLPSAEIARRVNAATPSAFSPLAAGVGGWSRFGLLKLDWRIPMFHNGFAPVLWARLSDDLGRTRIEGRFGASRFLQVFYVAWLAILMLIVMSLIAARTDDDPRTWVDPLAFLIVPLFMAAPFSFHFIFNRKADAHLEGMLAFLERVAGATPAP